MTRVIIKLYDHRDRADQIIETLHEAGFDGYQLDCVDCDIDDPDFTRRHFGAEPLSTNDRLRGREAFEALKGMGVPDEEATRYADGVRRGYSLVVVRSDAEIAGRARQIMDRFPAAGDVELTTHEGYYGPTSGESVARE